LTSAAAILAAGRRDSTWESYAGKFAKFVHFCTVVLPAAGVPAACPLPACAAVVLAYLGWLQDEDQVHHGSLQPYLTSINQAHQDAGCEKPATGKLVSLARKGFGELEVERRGATDQRVGLPAPAALQILDLGLTTTDLEIARAATAVVISYSFARGDTGANAAAGRLVVDGGGIHFNENPRTCRAPRRRR
jgi:hypothetical protein